MRTLLLFSLPLLLSGFNAQALSIQEAYRAIPHARTPFHILDSRMPQSEAKYLAQLLSLSELAMVERVEAMQKNPAISNYERDISGILRQLSAMQTPQKLQSVYKHIYTAIQEHRKYFALQDSSQNAQRQRLMQSSHRHLITAYNELMALYPDESAHNKKAFFDYLCALDFI